MAEPNTSELELAVAIQLQQLRSDRHEAEARGHKGAAKLLSSRIENLEAQLEAVLSREGADLVSARRKIIEAIGALIAELEQLQLEAGQRGHTHAETECSTGIKNLRKALSNMLDGQA